MATFLKSRAGFVLAAMLLVALLSALVGYAASDTSANTQPPLSSGPYKITVYLNAENVRVFKVASIEGAVDGMIWWVDKETSHRNFAAGTFVYEADVDTASTAPKIGPHYRITLSVNEHQVRTFDVEHAEGAFNHMFMFIDQRTHKRTIISGSYVYEWVQ